MQELGEVLAFVLSQTKFDCGREEETRYGPIRRSYASRPEETISAEGLCRIIVEGTWDAPALNKARAARVVCPTEAIAKLEDHLRMLFEDYVHPDTDRIGHAFPMLGMNGTGHSRIRSNRLKAESASSPISDFARGLLRGAAIIGLDGTLELVRGWMQSKPIRYRTSAIINGVYLNESLAPANGVHVGTLPWTTSELDANLPKPKSVEATDYLGRTVVSIDTEVSPPLFLPESLEASQQVSAKSVSGIDIATVCQALSLESDNCVDVGFYWNDYGDLTNFLHGGNIPSWSFPPERLRTPHIGSGWSMGGDIETGSTRMTPSSGSILHLKEERLRHTLESLVKSGSDMTRRTVSRWMLSKNSSEGLVDRFIDLRVALESLYLKDFINEQSQEMRFRLSLFGAWHLGADFGERKRIRKTLRDAYDAASGAVHTGDLYDSPENRKLLEDAQELCRRGIMKLLDEGPPSDWGDLILGEGED